MDYLKNELERQVVPLDNIFDPDYPDWGADNRGFKLYETLENTYVITTYGFNNEYTNFEIYIESSDGIEEFEQSWQRNLLYEVCRTVPEIEDFQELIEEMKYFVLQLHMDGAPEEWSLDNSNGNIGIFIGQENSRIQCENYKMINIKLMRPQELSYVIKNGEEGREKIASLYKGENIATNSSMARKSVI